jgi:peptide chain release factor 2
LAGIHNEINDPAFYSSPQFKTILKRQKELQSRLELLDALGKKMGDLEATQELLTEAEDEELAQEQLTEARSLNHALDHALLTTYFTDPHDDSDAILEIHSGAGGVDSQDWAEMLLRMYSYWMERNGYKFEIIHYEPGEEAGIKSATLVVKGDHAYGYLSSEAGVHRLVRLSPFDNAHRRHTSFASVHIYPDIEDDIEVDIREEDLRIDTYRASGAGGQHVNKTSSAVRITHIPTGIVVQCQNERSQHMNKMVAMRVLRARLYALAQAEREKELEAIGAPKMKIDFGSQIRNYVLHPYQLVKDLRTDYETGNVKAVLDGDLDEFIGAWLRQRAACKRD